MGCTFSVELDGEIGVGHEGASLLPDGVLDGAAGLDALRGAQGASEELAQAFIAGDEVGLLLQCLHHGPADELLQLIARQVCDIRS